MEIYEYYNYSLSYFYENEIFICRASTTIKSIMKIVDDQCESIAVRIILIVEKMEIVLRFIIILSSKTGFRVLVFFRSEHCFYRTENCKQNEKFTAGCKLYRRHTEVHVCGMSIKIALFKPLKVVTYPPSKKRGGTVCSEHSECLSDLCKENLCVLEGPILGKAGGGGLCDWSHQCYSNLCWYGTCAPDSVVQGKVAIGGPCNHGVECFTNVCFNHQCVIRPAYGQHGNKTHNSPCSYSRECFSNYCHTSDGSSSKCAPESPMPGKVASGGPCCHDDHCFSGHCVGHKCLAHGPSPGKISGGGACQNNDQCFSSYCLRGVCVRDSIVGGKVGRAGACDTNDRCFSSLCLNNVCQ